MDATIAKTFHEQVCSMIDEEADRDKVYESLKVYHNNHDIVTFVSDLKTVLCDPRRLPLFDDIRFLIPPQHQIPYDRQIPKFDLDTMRIVRLTRHGNESLGFSVRGGFEHEVGVYVSDVDPESQAYMQGLRPGDEIVRLNGFTINQAIHQEVLNLIKANKELVLKVRHVGLIPVKDQPRDKVNWKYVDIGSSTKDLITNGHSNDVLCQGEEVHLYINIPVNGSLGCSICSGPSHQPGIFIQSIKQGSLAEEAGLEIGDQIVKVNDVSLDHVTHSEAIVAFKSSKHLDLIIRKGVGIGLFKSKNDLSTSSEGRDHYQRPISNKNDKERNNKLLSSEDTTEVKWKQEDLLQQVINIIDSDDKQPSKNNAKLKAAVEMMSEGDQVKIQSVTAEVHSSSESTEQRQRDVGQNTSIREEKRPRLYRKNYEPIYSEIEEVTPLRNQPTRTGFDHPLTKQPPFPEASTDFRASPSYETTIVSTESMPVPSRTLQADRPDPNTVWSNADKMNTSNRNVTTLHIGESQSVQSKPQPKQLNPKIYRPVEIQSFQNQIPLRASKSPTSYLTEERKPNFRIQKPVLLHQTHKKDEEATKQAGTGTDKPWFNELTFNPNRLFTNEQIDGRQVKLVNINKTGCNDLGIVIETSQDRVIVGEIYEDGAIHKQGGVHVGDQIMMADGHSLIAVPVEEAYRLLKQEFKSSKPTMQLVVAKAPPRNFGNEVLPRPDYLDTLPKKKPGKFSMRSSFNSRGPYTYF